MVEKRIADLPDKLRSLSCERMEDILALYPWFDTVRLLLRQRTGKADFLPDAWLQIRPAPAFRLQKQPEFDLSPAESDMPRSSSFEAIDRFLAFPPQRIVPQENPTAFPVDLSAESVAEDPDLVSEELAEIFAGQGLYSKAKAIYSKLSLLYPEKSVYFAQLIAGLDGRKE